MEVSDEQLLKENSGIVVNNDTMSFKEQEWKTEHEKILVEWADKAMCYRWLHGRSHQAYSKTNAWFTIPVLAIRVLGRLWRAGCLRLSRVRDAERGRGFRGGSARRCGYPIGWRSRRRWR